MYGQLFQILLLDIQDGLKHMYIYIIMYIHTYIHTSIHIIHTYIHTYIHPYIHTLEPNARRTNQSYGHFIRNVLRTPWIWVFMCGEDHSCHRSTDVGNHFHSLGRSQSMTPKSTDMGFRYCKNDEQYFSGTLGLRPQMIQIGTKKSGCWGLTRHCS